MPLHPGSPDTRPDSIDPDSIDRTDTDFDVPIDRRKLLAGFAALLAAPGALAMPNAGVAAGSDWALVTQIIAGTRMTDPNVLSLAIDALDREVGADTVNRLHQAIVKRDAASITDPFEEEDIEQAARRFVEMVYTGELTEGDTVAFHQALAWKVLRFTKAPSVCGPGMGWWTNPPEDV